MTDSELNDRLMDLCGTAATAHETLRGVIDALGVLGQTTARAATEELEEMDGDEQGAWREEASGVAEQSETLLRDAAALLEKTAVDIRSIAETAEDEGDEEGEGR